MYLCMCVCVCIYIYIYRERERESRMFLTPSSSWPPVSLILRLTQTGVGSTSHQQSDKTNVFSFSRHVFALTFTNFFSFSPLSSSSNIYICTLYIYLFELNTYYLYPVMLFLESNNIPNPEFFFFDLSLFFSISLVCIES